MKPRPHRLNRGSSDGPAPRARRPTDRPSAVGPRTQARTFDAAIVGGGIMGLSTAYRLAGRGLRVCVLEKERIGAGSTGRSSAIVRQHYSQELTARMALFGLRAFQGFREELGEECGFRQTGFLVLVAEEDRGGLEANVALQRAVGIRTELLGPADVRELLPSAHTADLAAAAYEPESGYADPHLTLMALARAARGLGATILEGRRVTGIRFAGGRVEGVDTTGGAIDAPNVVNCAGPWAAGVQALAGSRVPIHACRAQVAILGRPTGSEAGHPVVIDFVHGSYFRPETGDLTLVGLVDPAEARARVDPDAYDDGLDPDFILDAGARFVRRWPPMERCESRGGFAGLYGVTPDWHPIVDELPPGSGCHVCAGFSGHGFKLAPAVGVMMADRILGETGPFPAEGFRFGRFEEGAPLEGRYVYAITG